MTVDFSWRIILIEVHYSSSDMIQIVSVRGTWASQATAHIESGQYYHTGGLIEVVIRE